MIISKALAKTIIKKEARSLSGKRKFSQWDKEIEEFSRLCEECGVRTHIAFLGTSIIAKAVNINVDLYAIKPNHDKENPFCYSARTLCHSVLVPMSTQFKFSLGVTGREPLNNQPYFRMKKFNDGTPIRTNSLEAYNYLCELIEKLSRIHKKNEIREALRSFIAVRKKYKINYTEKKCSNDMNYLDFIQSITEFTSNNSENGSRSQAVAAGIFDVLFGPTNVKSESVYNPSNKHPGDVCVVSKCSSDNINLALEVRDKPVSMSDVYLFCDKCLSMDVRKISILLTSKKQKCFDKDLLFKCKKEKDSQIIIFYGWKDFVEQIFFWSDGLQISNIVTAINFIRKRLVSIKAPIQTLEEYDVLMKV